MTDSPISLEVISGLFRFLRAASIFPVLFSSSSYGIGRFSHALSRPSITFSRLKTSLVPSFFTTTSGESSIRSKVVKRNPQFSHSLRLLMAENSSVCLESITLELGCLHVGHFI